MRKINTSLIEEKVYSAALRAGVSLTPSCVAELQKARDEAKSPTAEFALNTLLKNAETAEKENMPICQDTGLAVVLLEIGQEVYLEGKLLKDAVNEGVRRAYADGYFRKSVCDPLTRKNTGDNTPAVIHTEIVSGDKIKITFLPKGFGSENMSRLYMLKPAQGIQGVINAIVETVRLAGSRPCPPVYINDGEINSID